MHIEYLRLFSEVAYVRSISKVANHAHISQPALSQQIQRLEDSLGYKLLTRSNKGVELTQAGRIVEKYAKSLMRTYDMMIEDLNTVNESNNTIRIYATPSVATYALPCTIYKIKKVFPGYTFNLTSHASNEIEQSVDNDLCDVGFIQGRPHDCQLACAKVGVDRVVVVASQNFNIKQDIYCEDLLNYPLILLHGNHKARKELNNYFIDLGYNPNDYNILFSLDSTESIKSSVAKGYGLSFLPYISVKKELYTKQLKEINVLDFDMVYEIYIIYKRNKNMDKSVREFIQYIKKMGEKSFC